LYGVDERQEPVSEQARLVNTVKVRWGHR